MRLPIPNAARSIGQATIRHTGETRPEQLMTLVRSAAGPISAGLLPAGTVGGECACGGQATVADMTPVYAIANAIVARVPSQSVEMELVQADEQGRPVGTLPPAQQQEYLRQVLSPIVNLHIAREMCFVAQVSGVDAFVLQPMSQSVLLSAISLLSPPITDTLRVVVIGHRGDTAPASMCNGLEVPILLTTDIFPIVEGQMADAIVDAVKSLEQDEAVPMFQNMLQMANSMGDTDALRAINFLTVRFTGIYQKQIEMAKRRFVLTGVRTEPAPARGGRNVLNVIYTYQSELTDPPESWFASVDVTGEYPFLVEERMKRYLARPL